MMTKANGTLLTACLLTGIILPGQAQKQTKQKEKKPVNIVMFIADDLGANDITPYGNRVVRTPHLERLAGESLLFQRAFASSPTCAPSRASIHTGMNPFRHGAHANHSGIREGIKTLPQYLQPLGYKVALAGKLHLGPLPYYPFELIHNTNVPEPGHEKDGVLWTDLNLSPVDEWLSGASKENKPFALVVNDHSPHVIWPEKAEYDPKEVDIPTKHIDTESTRKSRARYYTDITKMDTNLGRLLQSLDNYGLSENTVVIFTCDQGPQWAFGKWNLYDYGIRVPLLIRWPGKIEGGKESHALVSLVDLLPTAVEIAGGKAPSDPEEIDGRSILPVLLGQQSSHRKMVFASHTGDGDINVAPMRMVRTERFKYIVNLAPQVKYNTHINLAKDHDGGREYWDSWNVKSFETEQAAYVLWRYHNRPAEELYDVVNDPDETINLAGNPHYDRELKVFRAEMSKWREQQGDKETGPFTYPKNEGKGPISPYIFK